MKNVLLRSPSWDINPGSLHFSTLASLQSSFSPEAMRSFMNVHCKMSLPGQCKKLTGDRML